MAALLILMPMTSQAGVAGEVQASRTLSLLQQSIQWVREHHGQPVQESAAPQPGPAIDVDTAGQGMAMAAIPLSSAPARETWAGQRFFLRGEDHGPQEPAHHRARARVRLRERVHGGDHGAADRGWQLVDVPAAGRHYHGHWPELAHAHGA